ncbi:hypothetical protein NDU88_005327 [Pleurodeles waltl]|uniref:Uncharacterized protein n=1 Tax=Pleurodeles waltl TaxID=8319 RepID=A0AAV7W7I7_PLEWA|nr:hypothetical protein NDU88_005327 [Pleurodeles waltl]
MWRLGGRVAPRSSSAPLRKQGGGPVNLTIWRITGAYPAFFLGPLSTNIHLGQGLAASSRAQGRLQHFAATIWEEQLVPGGAAPENTKRGSVAAGGSWWAAVSTPGRTISARRLHRGGVPAVDAPPQSPARQSVQAGSARRYGESRPPQARPALLKERELRLLRLTADREHQLSEHARGFRE